MSVTDFRKLSREMSGQHGFGGSFILVAVVALLASLIFWASQAELDNVTRGEGKVISSLQNQMVQAAEGGVILRRYVSENDQVAEGDLLFEIDPVDAGAEFNRLNQRFAALEIKEMRLQAEISGGAFSVPNALRAQSPSVASSEESLFVARKAELTGALSILEQRRMQREQDLASSEVSRETAERTLALLERELAVVRPLVAENIAPETRLLELERSYEQTRGDIARARAGAIQAQAGLLEIDSERQNKKDAYVLKAMDELSQVVAEKRELAEVLPSLEERVSRTVIRAPMEGIINRLNYRTPGGYVAQGDVVLEMVPTGEALIIEARIAPKDISNIRVGDAVRIRFSAYDSSRYGSVDGRVTAISADAITPDQQGVESYYVADVAIEGTLVVEEGEEVTFMPGMTATVDILSGKRTVLDYFWQPIAKTKEIALRD